MAKKIPNIRLVLLWYVVVVVVQVVNVVKGSAGNNELQIQIWPLPKDVSHGSSSNVVLSIPKDFHVSTKYDDVSGILRDAFSRLLSLIQLDHVVYPPTHFLNSSSSLLLGLNVVVSSIDQEVLPTHIFLFYLFIYFCLFLFFRPLLVLFLIFLRY